PFAEEYLRGYFPPQLRPYEDRFIEHRLSREITCTLIANELVNRGGLSFAFRLSEESHASVVAVVRAFVAAKEIFGFDAIWNQIEALDNLVPDRVQQRMLIETRKLLERTSRWILRRYPNGFDVETVVAQFGPGARQMRDWLNSKPGNPDAGVANAGWANELTDAGVSPVLARLVDGLARAWVALDVVALSEETNVDALSAANIYLDFANALNLDWLLGEIIKLPRATHWEARARLGLRDELLDSQQRLVRAAISVTADSSPTSSAGAETDGSGLVEAWMAANEAPVLRYRKLLEELGAAQAVDYPMMAAAVSEFRLLQASSRGALDTGSGNSDAEPYSSAA
nr:NAD-glutamate dehydrogenase [Gammaproteobacteria bacterium]